MIRAALLLCLLTTCIAVEVELCPKLCDINDDGFGLCDSTMVLETNVCYGYSGVYAKTNQKFDHLSIVENNQTFALQFFLNGNCTIKSLVATSGYPTEGICSTDVFTIDGNMYHSWIPAPKNFDGNKVHRPLLTTKFKIAVISFGVGCGILVLVIITVSAIRKRRRNNNHVYMRVNG
eukprot:TRINITY_DN5661_c0_g1_i1.p1 TRINITY_DN5661_c0_g1~~TRINITY_DN5661_c0_g1_i1.p1  ORF type:complete len:192 (+),score=31.37 TRINITY_DN5661_c0_g1_i1:48-578(+)